MLTNSNFWASVVAACVLTVGTSQAWGETEEECGFTVSGYSIPVFADTYGTVWYSQSAKQFAFDRTTNQCEDVSEDGSLLDFTMHKYVELRTASNHVQQWFVQGGKDKRETFGWLVDDNAKRAMGAKSENIADHKLWKKHRKKQGFAKISPRTVSPNGKCKVWTRRSKAKGELSLAVIGGGKLLWEVSKNGPIVASKQTINTYFEPGTKTFIAYLSGVGVPHDIDKKLKLTRRVKKQTSTRVDWLETVQVGAKEGNALALCFD